MTQPFAVRPAPFEYQGTSIDDLTDFTPEIRAMAVEAVRDFRLGGLFTPPVQNGTLIRPSVGSRAGWSGAAVDPGTGYLYVPSVNTHSTIGLSRPGPVMSNGLPLWKPPYSRLTGIDMNTGDHIWMVPTGRGDRYRNHPILRALNLPPLGGDYAHTGVLLTRTLLFLCLTAGGTNDGPRLVAYHKDFGAELASIDLPSEAMGPMMTYSVDGKQYLAGC